MSTTKHTPGPWSFGRYAGQDFAIHADEGPDFALVRGEHDDPTACANAALIAAAPDLLESLKGLVRYAEAVRFSAGMGEHQLKRLNAAKALIAAVGGGE